MRDGEETHTVHDVGFAVFGKGIYAATQFRVIDLRKEWHGKWRTATEQMPFNKKRPHTTRDSKHCFSITMDNVSNIFTSALFFFLKISLRKLKQSA